MVLAWNLAREVRANGFSYPVTDPMLKMTTAYCEHLHNEGD